MATVKAKVAHTQPGTLQYRAEGEEFELNGKPYKHVEPVKGPAKPKSEEEEGGSGTPGGDVALKSA